MQPCTSVRDCPGGFACVEISAGASFCQLPPLDAGYAVDAGPPADAGPDLDGDGDGLLASVDCDDADPTVGAMNVQTCTSACGFGTVVCTNGLRTSCTAPADCSCPTPGEVRTISCGRCGIASQTCGADSRWSTPSACTDERECMAGAVEISSARCGRQERVCDATCTWRSWTELVPMGECEPGEERTEMTDLCGAGAVDVSACSEACEFVRLDECRPLCRTRARLSRLGLEAVCVPEGPFVLGSNTLASSMPQKTISLSEFWIAREPVTAGAYRQCAAMSACTPIAAPEFAMADDTDAAIGATQAQATSFCIWDGGTLVTEFQWEKAARGPAPDARPHPWGDGPATVCEVIPGPGCEYPPDTTTLPESYSPYRVHLMSTIYEWTSTRFRADWSWVPDGSTDPASPPASMYPSWSRRGFPARFGEVNVRNTTAARGPRDGSESDLGFRCAY